MRVPGSIQVGGHTYEVVKIPFMPDNAAVTHRLQRILVNMESPNSQRTVGLIHEILHVVNEVYCNSRLGEDDIDGLAQGFLQILNQFGFELDFD